MYYSNYEDYMRMVLGYPMENTNSTYRNDNNWYSAQNNVNSLISNPEELYPEIYRKINPAVCQMCDKNVEPLTKELLEQIHFDAIKGNISEIKTLMAGTGHTKGVDASVEDQKNSHDLIDDIKAFAKELNTIIIVTGPVDYVTDGNKCYMINNGCKEMSTITGTGCMLSGILGCFLTVENSVDSAAAAVMSMGIAGEIGASKLKEGEGNATLRTYLIDALFNMTDEELEKSGKYEVQ